MNHTIITPELTDQEKQKVKAFREHNPQMRLFLFERSHFRIIAGVDTPRRIRDFQRMGWFVKEISLDFNID